MHDFSWPAVGPGSPRRRPGCRPTAKAAGAGAAARRGRLAGRGELRLLRPARAEPVGVSDSVLEALALALQLDEAERQHLFDLARAASVPASRSRPAKPSVIRVRPGVLSILNGMTGTPAYVRNARLDILAANDLCSGPTTAS